MSDCPVYDPRGPRMVHVRADELNELRKALEARPCPDGGACHHSCAGPCFRVQSCGPLSGVYPDDEWPPRVVEAHAGEWRAV